MPSHVAVAAQVREHCVANGVERGAFLAQMRSRHDRALYCEQDLGMSSLLAGRASRIFEQVPAVVGSNDKCFNRW